MPRGAAARALLCVIALITVIALAVGPVVDARPKDKKNNSETTTEVSSDASGDVVSDDSASQTTGNSGDERTLLSSDADGDYIPDSLDNCPNVQNPDQSDSDGDGAGDACPIYYDTDGDGVADKDDNCPGVSTSDFRDTDGDGVGDPCDKSPDGVEPEPVQVADYVDQGEPAPEDAELVNGANQDGQSVERDGRSRSRQRTRTETSDPIITTGSDGAETADGVSAGDGEAVAIADDGNNGVGSEGEIITEGPDAQPYEPSGRDNPRRNEELIAEAAASGELYAEPQPPPEAQRAWDDDSANGDWRVIVRIDSGADISESEQSAGTADASKAGRNAKPGKGKKKQQSGASKKGSSSNKRQQRDADQEEGDATFARGWSLAAVRLQEEGDPGDGEPSDGGDGVSPVPVENGLVLSGAGSEDTRGERTVSSAEESAAPVAQAERAPEGTSRAHNGGKKDDSRRNGSSRAAAAPAARPSTSSGVKQQKNTASHKADKKNTNREAKAKQRKRERTAKARQKTEQRTGKQENWSGDRYFDGGSVVDYRDTLEVAGTDDQDLYLTARTGDGPGKKRGFSYAIPVEREGSYLVRFYFVEPDDNAVGARVFSVAAEGDDLLDALDLTAEAGVGTAMVKQAEVRIDDGTLDLDFTASEGAPIISAIEVLEPAR